VPYVDVVQIIQGCPDRSSPGIADCYVCSDGNVFKENGSWRVRCPRDGWTRSSAESVYCPALGAHRPFFECVACKAHRCLVGPDRLTGLNRVLCKPKEAQR